MIEDLAVYYENIYLIKNPDETKKVEELVSHVYIPILDDPITSKDIGDAMEKMKKGL